MSVLTDCMLCNVVALLATIIAVAIAFYKWKLSYWDRVGVPTLNPSIPFGDSKKMLISKYSMGEQFLEFYNTFKARGVKGGGVYVGPTPFYIPLDLQLVKHIMQIDFAHFVNHGSYSNEVHDPLSAHLFSLEDAKWRNMRIKLTPTFTSGKMKMMFQTLADCTVGLNTVMDECADNNSPVDIKDILARFTTDIIGSIGFGLECNSLRDPDSLFRKYGRRVFDVSNWQKFKGMLTLYIPHGILRKLGHKITDPGVEEFFLKTVQDTVAYREKNNVYRKDFMHLLLQLKNRGTITDDDKIIDHGNEQKSALTMNELAAQCFVFFIAGFETSSTTMTFALYELATNQEIQEKLRTEIRSVLGKYDNQLTYDGMKEMTYMDQVLNETLRKYPPLATLLRICTKDYVVPGTNVTIKKGTNVAISTMGLQMDPEYFSNPETFDPDRFSEENKKNILPFTWMPFGEGPRICIGLRLGLLQSKVGLTALLRNYKISLSSKTKTPLVFDKNSFITSVQDHIWLKVEKLS